MASFSLTALMFGDHGIAHIVDIPPGDRARNPGSCHSPPHRAGSVLIWLAGRSRVDNLS
jgi:hypothetical protein